MRTLHFYITGQLHVNGLAAAWAALPEIETILVTIENCPGGDIDKALAIFNLLANHPAKKIITINGTCNSGGTIIAMAGTHIRMAQNGSFTVHSARMSPGDSTSIELEAAVKRLRLADSLILDIYEKRTGLGRDRLEQLVLTETPINATTALQYGFCDEIVEAGPAPDLTVCSEPGVILLVQ